MEFTVTDLPRDTESRHKNKCPSMDGQIKKIQFKTQWSSTQLFSKEEILNFKKKGGHDLGTK